MWARSQIQAPVAPMPPVLFIDVSIFSITGQLVKEFKGSFDSSFSFDIENLKQGMYIVKMTDDQDREAVLKLMKQ